MININLACSDGNHIMMISRNANRLLWSTTNNGVCNQNCVLLVYRCCKVIWWSAFIKKIISGTHAHILKICIIKTNNFRQLYVVLQLIAIIKQFCTLSSCNHHSSSSISRTNFTLPGRTPHTLRLIQNCIFLIRHLHF